MRVCVGGTFHPFHVGHEALLRAAAEGADALFVGVTDGSLAHRGDRDVPSWEARADRVRAFLEAQGFRGVLEVAPLVDAMGPARDGDYDRVVASPETAAGAQAINAVRGEAGLSPLEVRVVAHVLADDRLPVSGTRIARGDIDDRGRRRTPVRVAVGSANPVKVAAVEQVVGRVVGGPVEVRGVAVDSGVPEQPREAETLRGAVARARGARAAWPEADYAVGVEAGLNRDDDGAWYDVQACVVEDAGGTETRGWGPAFQYPAWVTARALAGEMVSDILGPVSGDPSIGGTTGAVGYLTDGLMDRTALTEAAVLMAFVPRIRRGLYTVGPDAT